MNPRYSVVVPAFESDSSVVELVERLVQVFEGVMGVTYEIILVDDGSRSPATWKAINELAGRYSGVRGVQLRRNYGKPSAVLCGVGKANGKWIITIDDDLQQRPEDIPALVTQEHHDVVVANYVTRQHGAMTVLASWIKGWFDHLILGLPCRMSPLKLFKAEVGKAMLEVQSPRPFIPALMAHVTTDFFPVTVTHDRSHHGKSRYNLRRRFRQFSNLLIGNSNLMLRCIGILGASVAISGFFYGAYIVVKKIVGPQPVPGWTTLVVINLLFGGIVLIALGIIGEYLIRIMESSDRKPAYVIRDAIDNEKFNAEEGARNRDAVTGQQRSLASHRD
jgi:glycosyltransferase involved in cell wall biosynthesis